MGKNGVRLLDVEMSEDSELVTPPGRIYDARLWKEVSSHWFVMKLKGCSDESRRIISWFSVVSCCDLASTDST